MHLQADPLRRNEYAAIVSTTLNKGKSRKGKGSVLGSEVANRIQYDTLTQLNNPHLTSPKSQ